MRTTPPAHERLGDYTARTEYEDEGLTRVQFTGPGVNASIRVFNAFDQLVLLRALHDAYNEGKQNRSAEIRYMLGVK